LAQEIELKDGVKYVANEATGKWGDQPKVQLKLLGQITDLGNNGLNAFMKKPCDIAADSKGNYYVVEQEGCCIKKFDNNLKYIKTFSRFGKGPGEFIRPGSIFIDKNDLIYVSDNMASLINVFDVEGKYLRNIKLKGHELYFGVHENGNIVVPNPSLRYVAGLKKLNLIHLLDGEGKFIKAFGKGIIYEKHPLSEGGNRFILTSDQNENIIIVFLFQNRIEKYNAQGKLLVSASRVIKDEMLINKKENTYYSLSVGVDVDNEGRIWNLERVNRPRMTKEDIKKATYKDVDGIIKFDKSRIDWPDKTNQYAVDLYNPYGEFLFRYPLDHYCSNLRVIGDRLFICDTGYTMDFYVYQIVNTEAYLPHSRIH
jgi:hypothetical protein